MGVPCRCPRTGGLGQRQHLFLRRFSQSEKRNSAAEKRGRAKIPSPQPPSFLPARANFFQKSASGFSRKKVRILSKSPTQSDQQCRSGRTLLFLQSRSSQSGRYRLPFRRSWRSHSFCYTL